MPVGYSDNMESFNTSQFQINSLDVIYTITDGFVINLVGQKVKSLKYKQLKDF